RKPPFHRRNPRKPGRAADSKLSLTTVFSVANSLLKVRNRRRAEFLNVFAGMWNARRFAASHMAVSPRVIVALPDVGESETVGEWLSANHFEPVRQGNARTAAREM